TAPEANLGTVSGLQKPELLRSFNLEAVEPGFAVVIRCPGAVTATKEGGEENLIDLLTAGGKAQAALVHLLGAIDPDLGDTVCIITGVGLDPLLDSEPAIR